MEGLDFYWDRVVHYLPVAQWAVWAREALYISPPTAASSRVVCSFWAQQGLSPWALETLMLDEYFERHPDFGMSMGMAAYVEEAPFLHVRNIIREYYAIAQRERVTTRTLARLGGKEE